MIHSSGRGDRNKKNNRGRKNTNKNTNKQVSGYLETLNL